MSTSEFCVVVLGCSWHFGRYSTHNKRSHLSTDQTSFRATSVLDSIFQRFHSAHVKTARTLSSDKSRLSPS